MELTRAALHFLILGYGKGNNGGSVEKRFFKGLGGMVRCPAVTEGGGGVGSDFGFPGVRFSVRSPSLYFVLAPRSSISMAPRLFVGPASLKPIDHGADRTWWAHSSPTFVIVGVGQGRNFVYSI